MFTQVFSEILFIAYEEEIKTFRMKLFPSCGFDEKQGEREKKEKACLPLSLLHSKLPTHEQTTAGRMK